MKDGGMPLHGCTSRAKLLESIAQGCDVNAVNSEGKTALHVMVEKNSLECVVSLLSHDAKVDCLDKAGNTALHIAVEKKLLPIVQCLVVFGADFNRTNRDGMTPRHMVGTGGSVANILYILHAVGAKRCAAAIEECPKGCSADGTYDGVPPEQPESPEQREHIHQVLASTIKLKSTTVPKTVAGNALAEQKRPGFMRTIFHMIVSKVFSLSKSPKTEGGGNSTSRAPQSGSKENCSISKSQCRLLCLDGGGIRGIILVQMLLEMEQLAQRPVHHMFDWVAGTSTGGILALALGAGKTIRQCLCLYLRMKEQAFIGLRPYGSDNLENLLKDNLGAFSVMTDITHPKIMVTGVMADRKPVELHLFRNYTSASDILGRVTPTQDHRRPLAKPEDQLVWKAARATAAAPTYFQAFAQFLDGGLIANNPTLDAMTEIQELNMALHSVGRQSEAVPVSTVISLGTGSMPVTELKIIPALKSKGFWELAKLYPYYWRDLVNLLVDQATAADGRVVDRARAWCSTAGIPYFRFNPQLSENIAMNETNDKKLINMLWETKAYMYANRNRIIEMIGTVSTNEDMVDIQTDSRQIHKSKL